MDHLISERHGHVFTITMNRPYRLNAISGPMLREMSRLLVECDADRDVRAVVLTGAGRGFCAGLDLQDLAAGEGLGSDPGGLGTRIDDTPPFVLRRIDVPVICRLNGPAAGYGTDLALGCDVVIASERASFTPPVKRSALPESGGTWLLPRLVGWHKACEVALFGRKLDAAELLRLGLVNTVVSEVDLDRTVASWVEDVVAMPPLAVRAAKRAMRLGLDSSFDANSHHVLAELLNLFRTEDFKESLASFIEKRPANYTGR
jgi:enoyl-CoA hydratase/carnithine racemase